MGVTFLFFRMDVYKLSRQFAVEAETLSKSFQPSDSGLADQLRRASSSILLNISEGFGRWHKRDKTQFYRLALGSTNESAAALDQAVIRGLLPEREFERLCGDLDRIAQMIQGMIRGSLLRHGKE